MPSSKFIGKIVWWSERDQNGILEDSKGNEYYFDRSVVSSSQKKKLIKGSLVLFAPRRCDGILAAKNVTIPRASSIKKYNEQFNLESLQLPLSATI